VKANAAAAREMVEGLKAEVAALREQLSGAGKSAPAKAGGARKAKPQA
jgi:hypothetical protein